MCHTGYTSELKRHQFLPSWDSYVTEWKETINKINKKIRSVADDGKCYHEENYSKESGWKALIGCHG